MALFGNDRPVMPSFRTTPELDSSARSPYDDLNRIERNLERNGRQLDRDMRDERNSRDRAERDREERHADGVAERNGSRPGERNGDRTSDRSADRNELSIERNGAVPAKSAPAKPQPMGAARPHALIEGLFDKLPEPESEWSLQARQKWLQTAANIFDLMYLQQGADAGELSVRVERTSTN